MNRSSPQRFGPYTVYEQIGKGGMSTVHLAETQGKDGVRQRVALKRLLPHVSKEIVEAFVQEATINQYLQHPNIAATYDSGKIKTTYYMVMEYVSGPTLRQVVNQCSKADTGVPDPITLSITRQLLEALDHAHTRTDERGKPLGIIHRDVSPANVVLSDTGFVKLIDFGLAQANLSAAQTGEGVIKGKFGYVAPEYLAGQLDARADLWAVGVLMYELLTSRRLFDGPSAFETMSRVRKLPIPRPSRANPKVSAELDDIVMKALERDPDRRWQTASSFRNAVKGVIAQPGNLVDNQQVIDWVTWVFTQGPPVETSEVSKLMAIAPQRRADTDEPVKKKSGMWLLLVLVAAAAAAVAAWQLGYV